MQDKGKRDMVSNFLGFWLRTDFARATTKRSLVAKMKIMLAEASMCKSIKVVRAISLRPPRLKRWAD